MFLKFVETFLTINMGTLPLKISIFIQTQKSERVCVRDVAAYETSKFRKWEPQNKKIIVTFHNTYALEHLFFPLIFQPLS
jgi:hypothetical protein